MKKVLSAILALLIATTTLSFAVNAASTNEPTNEQLERIIKIVKPKLDVPEQCSEFNWYYTAKNVYGDTSWRLTWKTKTENNKESERVIVRCDENGNLTSYMHRKGNNEYGSLPGYSKDALEKNATDFISKVVPQAAANVKLESVNCYGIYSNQYTYKYVRYIDGYKFPDNYISIDVDYTSGRIASMSVNYDYEIDIKKYNSIIAPEKALEILGTRKKMQLEYMTKTEKIEGKNTVKAFLVYVPQEEYVAIDAETGEIYDTKSVWNVKTEDSVSNFGEAVGGGYNSKFDDAEEKENSYILTDEETNSVNILEGLISKEEAIKAVTSNPYLYIDSALTAVEATLEKNNLSNENSLYKNDNGSYIWYIYFSNPVFDDKYYSDVSAYAEINAENGNLISYSCNLNDYIYYREKLSDVPEVKYNKEKAQAIAEEFLKAYADSKFSNTVENEYYQTNVISRIENGGDITSEVYGAHRFSYTRINEGVTLNRNYINVGVDGVTGKIFSYNYNWWTNVEFESVNGIITPEQALAAYVSNDGYGLIYEKNTTYIYTPVTASSKKDVCSAFVASLAATLINDGDIDKVIDKYAEKIDRTKLKQLLYNEKENELMDFICEYFGVNFEEINESASEYIDSSMFYDKISEARLVYTCYDVPSDYVSPFSGKLLKYNGEEYKFDSDIYAYDDLEGHWIKTDAELLADVGIGFGGGSFKPDANITADEFVKLAEAMNVCLKLDSQAEIKRIDAIKALLNCFGYEKVAKLNGIYVTDFEDNGAISQDDIGYTAIAYGLGIIKGDGKNADIYSKLTRAQAVSLLINTLKYLK